MATIRIPIADEQIQTPSAGAGQVRTRRQAALREPGAGQLPAGLGQMDTRAANIDVGAAGALGQAGQRIGTALDQFAEAEAKMRDETDLRAARVSLSRRLGEIEVDFQGRDLRDSGAAATEYNRVAGEARDEIGQNLGGRARQLWTSTADELILPREFNVRRDAFQRNAQAAVATLQDDLRSNANFAAASRNPAERETYLREGQAAIEGAVSAGFMNPEAAGRLARGFRSDVQMADVNRLMATNPAAAIRLLGDQAATPDIEADRRQSLVNSALTRQDAMAARAEAAAGRAEASIGREVSNFNSLLSQGIVPEGRADRVLAMARGTRLEPQVRQMIDDSRGVQAFALASDTEQTRLLTEADTRRRGPNASDVDQANFARLAQVRQNQITGVREEGLGYSIRLGTVDPQPPINWADPATLNSRVAAASGETRRMGRPVSGFTREDLASGLQTFLQSGPDQRLSMIEAMAKIDVPDVRRAMFQHFERGRGEGGSMPPGILPRIGDMLQSGNIEDRQSARRLIGDLGVPVEGRTRQVGESAEMNAALVAARDSGVLSSRVLAAQIAGGGPFANTVRRDEETIQRAGAARLTAGGTSATAAVRAAQADVERGLLSITDPSLAGVSWPGRLATTSQVTDGLRALRDETARVAIDPAAGAEANLAARARQTAARSARWVNEGSTFALVAQGAAGAPVVLRTATLEEITGAAQTGARRDAADPPVMRRERALEQERRGQRQAPPAPDPVPVIQ